MACFYCGDNVEEDICYSCEETAEELGIDIDELNDLF
jgi:hypothetical protein